MYYKGECITFVEVGGYTYGGTYDTFGSFFATQSGFAVYIQLTHVSGGFKCPSNSSVLSPWGCNEDEKAEVYLTDISNKRLDFYPKINFGSDRLLIISNKGKSGTVVVEGLEYRIRSGGDDVAGYHTVKVAFAFLVL